MVPTTSTCVLVSRCGRCRLSSRCRVYKWSSLDHPQPYSLRNNQDGLARFTSDHLATLSERAGIFSRVV